MILNIKKTFFREFKMFFFIYKTQNKRKKIIFFSNKTKSFLKIPKQTLIYYH